MIRLRTLLNTLFGLPVIFVAISCGGDPGSGTENNTDTSSAQNTIEPHEITLSPVEFNNELTFMQQGILTQVDELFSSDSGNIDLNLENTLFEIQLNLESLRSMKVPAGGNDFNQAMVGLLEFYNTEFTGPFNEVVELLKKKDWTDTDEKFVNDYDTQFALTEKEWFEAVIIEQDKFAKANNIRLTDD